MHPFPSDTDVNYVSSCRNPETRGGRVCQSKGFHPREEDVPIILAIHNTVNEQGEC
jgi:hypothetical protein